MRELTRHFSDDTVGIIDHYSFFLAKTPLNGMHRAVHTFRTSPQTASNPHASVQMQVSWITRLHGDVHAEGVRLGVHFIGFGRALELLQHVAWANAPAVVLDCDVSGWVVVGLEEVFAVDVG